MIYFEFDRDKLTPREIQIVGAIIETHQLMLMGAILAAGVGLTARTEPLERAAQERLAGVTQKRLARHFPDLSLRWEWRDDMPGA